MGEIEVELAEKAYAAFNRGDVEGALKHLDPAIEWRMSDQFTRTVRVFHGHDGVREVFGLFTEVFDDFRAEVKRMDDAGDHVVAEVRVGGLLRGTDEPASYELVQVWAIRNRKAVRLDVYATREEAWSAIGITPPAVSSDAISDSGIGRANK